MSSSRLDLVIRRGLVVDGSGAPGFVADVGVRDGKIVEIGTIRETGQEEIDARDKIVTPGFVDIHTHYDGQAVWSREMTPSSWHGVTTAVMGNCGVGFAPCRSEDRDLLIELMEGVEDIPGAAMHEGLNWRWETFGDYLDVLDQTTRDIDICALIPHAPLRVYVMGERALRLEPATPADIASMRSLVGEAITAGAFGVSSSRATVHRSGTGNLTPTVLARESEINGLLMGMSDAGRGLFQVINESRDPDVRGEYEMIARALKKSGRRGIYSLFQNPANAELWREIMTFSDETIANGTYFRPVVAPRPVALLFGLETSKHPFVGTRTYRAIAHLDLAERVTLMRTPEVRAQMLADDPWEHYTWEGLRRIDYGEVYRLSRPYNYAPSPDDSVGAMSAREGRPINEIIYDLLLEDDGMGLLYVPLSNYAYGDLSACESMLANPNSIMGLGDAGAHVGFLLDGGFPTWLLAFWVNEQQRFSLSEGVRRLTSDTADVMGLSDRGQVRVGLRADLNVINLDELGLGPIYVDYDLPSGGKRLLQRGTGYEATIVAGTVSYRDGQDSGGRSGRLVRSSATIGA